MNRRTSIKSILGIGLLGGLAFSVFEWEKLGKTPDVKVITANKHLVDELAETIIPTTDTPGAKDAAVGDFIISMQLNCTDVKNQNIFIDGLTDVQDYSNNLFSKNFEACNPAQKAQVLSHFEAKAHGSNGIISKVMKKYLGTPFFTQLRDLTVKGYCTSEPGATKGLAYDYIPGSFQACIPLQPGQRSWATK